MVVYNCGVYHIVAPSSLSLPNGLGDETRAVNSYRWMFGSHSHTLGFMPAGSASIKMSQVP